MATYRFWTIGILLMALFIVLIIAVAQPSWECEAAAQCYGVGSICVDHYCQCDAVEAAGWRCQERYLGFRYYRGYGSPYTGIIVLGIFFATCFICLWPSCVKPSPNEVPREVSRPLVPPTVPHVRLGKEQQRLVVLTKCQLP